MMAFILMGLDYDLQGFKDQILASETLPSAANAYSRLLRSCLGQASSTSESSQPLSSFALISSSSDRGRIEVIFLVALVLVDPILVHNYTGSRGSRGGHYSHGSSGGSGRGIGAVSCGDWKCTLYDALGHSDPGCQQKYGKPDHMNQVMDASSSPSTLVPSGLGASPTDSNDALTTQISELTEIELVISRTTFPSSSTATLASSGNVAYMAQSP